jgi:hypothetical protein
MLLDSISYLSGSDWNYDIAGSTLSTPSDGDVITRFTATRDMKIKAELTHIAFKAGTNPTANATFTVKKNGTSAFTFTVGTGGTVSGVSGSDVAIVEGDLVEIEATTISGADDIGLTLKTVANG